MFLLTCRTLSSMSSSLEAAGHSLTVCVCPASRRHDIFATWLAIDPAAWRIMAAVGVAAGG